MDMKQPNFFSNPAKKAHLSLRFSSKLRKTVALPLKRYINNSPKLRHTRVHDVTVVFHICVSSPSSWRYSSWNYQHTDRLILSVLVVFLKLCIQDAILCLSASRERCWTRSWVARNGELSRRAESEREGEIEGERERERGGREKEGERRGRRRKRGEIAERKRNRDRRGE